jgi:hypothetical protein
MSWGPKILETVEGIMDIQAKEVEHMNRTIKEATVQRYDYDRHDQLETHLADFINANNYARRLRTLRGVTPYECICRSWTSQPERFKLNPPQKMPGLNT